MLQLLRRNPHIAEEACTLIDVEYEVLPPVLEVRQAMEPDAPLLHENLKTTSMGETADEPSNVASHIQHTLGDTEKGFAEADVIIEREFVTGTVHQGYIEPHNATAHYNARRAVNNMVQHPRCVYGAWTGR